MKKTLSVLLSIIMIISVLAVIPFTANAEISSVTIGEPVKAIWGIPTDEMERHTKSHYIIDESDMGALKGKEITGLRWYFLEEEKFGLWENYSPEERNVDIYLTETDLEQVTSLIDVSSSTRVFSGIWSLAGYSDLSDIEASLVDVTFDCPYLYSGKNLLVTVVDRTGMKNTHNPHALAYYRANGGYHCSGEHSMSASDTASTNTDEIARDYIPVTTFYYEKDNNKSITVTYNFNGGTKGGKGTYVTEQVAYAPDITAANFIDALGVTQPEGMVLDAIEINGKRYELGSTYLLNKDTTYKYIWKSTHTHKYTKTTTKATLTKNGSIVEKCSCGKEKSKTVIYYPKTVKLSAASYTYNGKAKKPTVTVKDSKDKTVAASGYTVSYGSGRKNVGKYTVTVKFKGNYSGTKKLTFKINPKKTSASKVESPKKAQLKITIKKQATQTTGYQIQYGLKSSFSDAKTVTVSSNKTTKKTVSKLKSGKKYYVRVRTYKTVSGTKYYSGWTKYGKAVKVK